MPSPAVWTKPRGGDAGDPLSDSTFLASLPVQTSEGICPMQVEGDWKKTAACVAEKDFVTKVYYLIKFAM